MIIRYRKALLYLYCPEKNRDRTGEIRGYISVQMWDLIDKENT
jgi:hypothetical protein